MKTKTVKVALNGFGELLGREKGCLVVEDRKGKYEKYPLTNNAIARTSSFVLG
jgi:hypothetical protein